MARARLRADQIRDVDNLTEPEHDALVHENLVTSGTLNFQDGTISGTGNVYATYYYGDGSNLTGIDAAAGLNNVVEDTSPELGGDLGTGSYTISGTGDIYCNDLYTADSTIYLGTDTKIDADGIHYWDTDTWYLSIRTATFGPAWLYYEGGKAISTGPDGAVVWHPTSTTPTIGFQNSSGNLYQKLNGSSTDFTIKNLQHAGHIILEGDDAGGNEHTILDGDPDGALLLYYDGTKTLETKTTGIFVQPTTGSDCQLTMRDASDTNLTALRHTGGNLEIRNYNHGGYIFIRAEDGAGAAHYMIKADPDNSVDLYYDGNVRAETTNFGMTLYAATQPSLGFYDNGASAITGWVFMDTADDLILQPQDGSILLDANEVNGHYIENRWGNDGTKRTYHFGDAFYGTNNTLTCGTSANAWSDVHSYNWTTKSSDRRKKTTISGSDLGLDFINELNPVSFKFKSGDFTRELPDGTTFSGTDTFHRRHYGFIAQDVEATLSGIDKDTEDFAGFVYNEEDDFYGLREGEFISPMVKAIQELSDIVDSQAATIAAQQATISGLITRIEALES